jgi:hypothetical protein
VFLVKIGGFDSHASQVETNDTTMGVHATKMYHISAALKAFQQDLKNRGISDKVLTISMSEFGRRINSNGSYGTDHGKGGSVMLFGDKVNAGVFGTNPDMSKNNIDMQFDYRQLYSGILHDWFGVEQTVINQDIFFKDFFNATDENGNALPDVKIISNKITGNKDWLVERFNVSSPFPNPAKYYTSLNINSNIKGIAQLQILDQKGTVVKSMKENLQQGRTELRINTDFLKQGMYYIKIDAQNIHETKKLVIQ